MQITDEMVEAACLTMYDKGDVAGHLIEMKAALEAAWSRHEVTQKYAPPLDHSLRECIKDLAGALKTVLPPEHFGEKPSDATRSARATLERWNLK